jgi:hypothetical protein
MAAATSGNFDEFANHAIVGSQFAVNVEILKRSGSFVDLGISAGSMLSIQMRLKTTKDPIPSNVVAAFQIWDTDDDARKTVETYVWDTLLATEFVRKMPNLKITLERAALLRDGTRRTSIRLVRHGKPIREFEFIQQMTDGQSFIRSVKL